MTTLIKRLLVVLALLSSNAYAWTNIGVVRVDPITDNKEEVAYIDSTVSNEITLFHKYHTKFKQFSPAYIIVPRSRQFTRRAGDSLLFGNNEGFWGTRSDMYYPYGRMRIDHGEPIIVKFAFAHDSNQAAYIMYAGQGTRDLSREMIMARDRILVDVSEILPGAGVLEFKIKR